jgi:hypothetical protein
MIRFHLKGVLGVKGVQGDLSKEILSYVNGPLSKEIVHLSMILLKTLSAQAHTHEVHGNAPK